MITRSRKVAADEATENHERNDHVAEADEERERHRCAADALVVLRMTEADALKQAVAAVIEVESEQQVGEDIEARDPRIPEPVDHVREDFALREFVARHHGRTDGEVREVERYEGSDD